jgi:integrase
MSLPKKTPKITPDNPQKKKLKKLRTIDPIDDINKLEEFKRAAGLSGRRNYIMVLIGINTGLRIGDILRIKVSDVRDREKFNIQEQKTGKARTVYLQPSVQLETQEYIFHAKLKDSDFLLASHPGGGPLSRTQAWRIIKKAGEACGLENIGTHTLRKTFGYHHYNQNKDVVILQQIFNHSAPSVTLRYIGIKDKEIRENLMNFCL